MTASPTVSRFRPVHDAHAIVEETIFLEFTPPLQQAMPALLTLKEELKDEFTAIETLNVMQVQVTQQQGGAPQIGPQQISEGAGLRMIRSHADGTIETVINIQTTSVTITCNKYTRWDEIWPHQKSYISRILAKIHGTNSFLTGIGMRWVDQFVYDGDEPAYAAAELLRSGSAHLNPLAFSSGTRWHCHTGWFNGGTNPGRDVLNQLNVDAGQMNVAGEIRTAVAISHIQALRIAQRLDELASFNQASDPDHRALSGLMEALHDGNKRVLRELLTDSMIERIGLGAE
ncbi:TIGR04255 family protein [Methylobacterium sp. J-048]|uniref:TIGR04255 family protein n=1 Tax=Methylobacterium sp. J-048 TaxID=2836635 RepID=UPI001FB96AE2|nr:TIGR04255 family protein [Methylobacterium sp. J-048]MCJ2059824.1 TIGR04255 family protein [Methylobacterium sp. J-048]